MDEATEKSNAVADLANIMSEEREARRLCIATSDDSSESDRLRSN